VTGVLDQALVYAASGMPVFPCAPRSKTPSVPHGFHDATTDLGQIEQWWWREPRANVATPTGLDFDVVDFDNLDLYEQARDTYGLDGPQVRTARGAHFYVRASGRRTTKLTPGIDYKAVGGYVLLPPSRHPDGPVYEWIQRGDPAPAPSWLRALLDDHAAPARQTRPDRVARLTLRSVASLRAMADRLANTEPGNRNAFLFWCACTAADTGATSDDVAVVLRDAARRAGLEEREITRTLDSAFGRWR
jgi:hypothetical protein